MEEKIINRFTKEVVSESVQRFCVKDKDITMIGKHQNNVFRANVHDRTIFIRITHESHRTKQLIQAEIEWIEYLSNNGILVAKPIFSRKERIENKIPFIEVDYSKLGPG